MPVFDWSLPARTVSGNPLWSVKIEPSSHPSQHRVGGATLADEPPSFTERQFVEHRRYRPVRHIETGQPALRAEIVAALGEQQVGLMNSDRASVVDRARPRIAGKVGQTLRKPALQFHAQRVVIRLAAATDRGWNRFRGITLPGNCCVRLSGS